MHELSIAYSLVNVACEAAQAANIKQVEAVHLRLGALSGVVKDALLFGYDIAAQGTLLEGSRLEIEELPVMIKCPKCEASPGCELASIQRFRCPIYDIPTANIVQGQELEIKSLEYAE